MRTTRLPLSGFRRSAATALPLSASLTRFRSAAAVCAALAMASEAGYGAVTNWTAGSNTDLNWSTGTNWSGGEPTGADDAIFVTPIPNPGALLTPGTITLGAGELANSLTIRDAYTFTGGDLALTSGLVTVAPTITTIFNSALTTNNLTLAVNNGLAAGAAQAGGGTLVLGGANTLTGVTSINAGTLVAAAATALGTSSVAVSSGTALEIGGATIGNNISLASGATLRGGAFGAASTGTVTVAAGGTVNLGSTTAGETLTLGDGLNDLTGGGAGTTINLTGAGTVALAAFANDVTANWTIGSGTLQFQDVGALGNTANVVTVSTGGTLEAATPASQALAHNVILTGGTLSNANNNNLSLTAAGRLTVNANSFINVTQPGPGGKIQLVTGTDVLTGSGNITKTGAGTLQMTSANPSYTGALTVQGGQAEIQNLQALGATPQTITVDGGELVASNLIWAGNINAVSGTVAGNAGNSTYSGTITAAGDFRFGLRDFNATGTGRTLNVTGTLTGAGRATALGPTAGAGILALTANRATHTGAVSTAANSTVQINAQQAISSGGFVINGGTLRNNVVNFTGFTAGQAGVNASYYSFGNNPTASNNPTVYATDQLLSIPRVFTRIDQTIDIPNGLAGLGTFPVVPVPGYSFAFNDGAMWKGLLNVTTAGVYDFASNVDDQDVLFIDGVQIGSHAANNGTTITPLGTGVTLSAGPHSIVYKYSQGGGGGYASLRYSGPDTASAQVVVGSVAGSLTTGSLAAQDLGPLTVDGTGTLDTGVDTSSPTLALNGGTWTLTSGTLSNHTVTGATTLGGLVTLAPTTAGLILNGAIGGTGDITHAGPYFTNINATSTFIGTTTVTGGQVRLNAAGGNTIGSGGLTINATPNVFLNHVVYGASNQIPDSAPLAVLGGTLSMGAFSDTVASISLSGGRILGTGTLTSAGALDLQLGEATVAIAGSGGVTKTLPGLLTLGGTNTFTGTVDIQSGVVRAARSGALGAVGAGNGTVVADGAALEVFGSSTLGAELLTISGAGESGTGASATGALRNIGGDNSLTGTVTLAAPSVIRSDAGNLTLGAATAIQKVGHALTFTGSGEVTIGGTIGGTGQVTKEGRGTLTFTQNLTAAQLTAIAHNAGVLGFSGPQTLGAVSVPTGRAYKFYTSPGAGTTVGVNAGSAVIAGTAAADTVLARIAAGSSGAFLLGVDSAAALNFAANPDLTLGAVGLRTFSGAITPGANGYRFGAVDLLGPTGFPGRLTVASTLSGAAPLQINGAVQLLGGNNSATGDVMLNAGADLFIFNNPDLGNAANALVLNGGRLTLTNTGLAANGSTHIRIPRVVNLAAGGGTIDIGQGSIGVFNLTNALQGTGTLTKTGVGEFQLVGDNNTGFTGSLVVGPQGGVFDVRAGGRLTTGVGAITVNQSSILRLNNRSTVALFPVSNDGNRLGDTIPVTLAGGSLNFEAQNVAGAAASETVGTITIALGQANMDMRQETQGLDFTITNLSRALGGGTLRITSSNGTPTFGGTGANPRVLAGGLAPGLVGGWLTLNNADLVNNVGGATGLQVATYSVLANAPTPGTGNFLATNTGNATADVTIGTAGAPADFSISGLKLSGAATRQLLFSNETDRLFIGSGGVISDNVNNARNIGSAAVRGQITAGLAAGNAAPAELFFHQNQNTLTVFSQIVNNNGQAVSVFKDFDGTLLLDPGAAGNLYSGGTFALRGTLQANGIASLGAGPVTVKNSRVNVNAAGSIADSATAGGFTLIDQGELFLNAASSFTNTWDRFNVGSGSTLIGPGAALNSLTRVSTLTAGGQVVLAEDSIVGHTTFNNNAFNGAGTNTVQNLGTNADLFYGLSGNANAGQLAEVRVGTGTPWKGISTDRTTRAWQQGTIFATSDFILQGLRRDGATVALTLGGNTVTGTYSIANLAGVPINAFVQGTVALDEDSPVTLPSDLTFVVGASSILQLNRTNSLGSGTDLAKVLVQAGGTLDPGAYVGVGAGVNQPLGRPYPIPGPINSQVTFEAGARFLLNDGSGLGTSPAGSLIMKSGSILHLGSTSNALIGNNNGLINNNQFAFSPGVIVRQEVDNTFMAGELLSAQPGGLGLIWQAYNADRTITQPTNPFVAIAVGTPTVSPTTIQIGAGGGLTNDSNTRTFNAGRGKIEFTQNGAFIAATSGTVLGVRQSFDLLPGVTLQIGSLRDIDGNPKLGQVRLGNAAGGGSGGAAVNSGNNTNTISVVDGAELWLSTNAAFPNGTTLNLNGPTAQLRLDSGGGTGTGSAANTEAIGALTGNGIIIANQASQNIAVGVDVTSDFTFAGSFNSNGTNQSGLTKWGTTKLTLTGVSASTGDLRVEQGTVEISGQGTTAFGLIRPGKGGTLILNNTVDALDNRLGFKAISGQGGTVRLIGNAVTPVTESFSVLNNSGNPTGGFTFLEVVPGAPSVATMMSFNSMESFQSAGNRHSTFVLRTPTITNQPGTYDTNSLYTPNPANLTSGLITIGSPNFTIGASFNQQNAEAIPGVYGTAFVGMRPDLLGDPSGVGNGAGFVTQEPAGGGLRLLAASEYLTSLRVNSTLNANLKLSGLTAVTGDTRVQSLTLNPGSTITIDGTLPNNATKSRLQVSSGGIYVASGAASTISGTGALQASIGAGLYFHTQGNLNIGAPIFSDTALIKTGNGTLDLGAGTANFWRGTLSVHDGTVNLGADNSFFITRGANNFTGQGLNLAGGTLNLNGNSQFLNAFNSPNVISGTGGTLTSATPANVTVQGGGTFSGQVTGAISLTRAGGTALGFTNDNTYSGATTIRGGTLHLRDNGRISGTSGISIIHGTLQLENAGLAVLTDRVPDTVPITLNSGTFDFRGAPSLSVTENIGPVTLAAGQNTLAVSTGGNGVSSLVVANLIRTPASRTFLNFNLPFGFQGAVGTTSARTFLSNLNGAPVALSSNLVGPWAIANGDHFASYSTVTGIGSVSNTADGYAAYDSGDVSLAAATANVNDGTNRTIAASKTVNALRYGGGTNTLTIGANQVLTLASGGLLTNAGNATVIGTPAGTGGLTSGSDSLYAWINQNTTTINAVISGGIDLVKGGGGTLTLAANNTYTGRTYAYAGTTNLSLAGANGTTTVSVPGDLEIRGATVTHTVANQLRNTANVTIYGDGIYQVMNAASINETIGSVTLINEGGGTGNRPIIQRSAAQATSSLTFSGTNAITAVNQNIASVPSVSLNLGLISFTSPVQPIISVTSEPAFPLGLVINAGIGSVPATGIAKTGPGMLAMGGAPASTFGSPATPTDVFFVKQGILRVEGATADKMGGVNAVTVVEGGAGYLGRTGTINGSVRLLDGSFLGTTEGNTAWGTATNVPGAQSVLSVVGNALLHLTDYFMPKANTGNLTVNGQLTGSGGINLVGVSELTQGAGGGGALILGNPIRTGAGSTDYSGIITVNPNTILQSQVALAGGTTSASGSALGASSIVLNGGRLRLRDDFSTDNTNVSNTTAAYGNNVTLAASSYLDANRTVGTGVNNVVNLGTLNVNPGSHVLTVDSGNGYRVGFASLDGSGTLVKSGNSFLDINGIAPTFTGRVAVAGPTGLSVGHGFGPTINVPLITPTLVTAGALHSAAGDLTIGTLETGSNAGTVVNGTSGQTNNENRGGFAVAGAGTVTVTNLVNNGYVGPQGGDRTIAATTISGTGYYATFGNALTVSGNTASGATTALKVIGDNVVTLTGTTHAHTGGVDVQAGTLRIAPTAATTAPLGAGGTVVVRGVPASNLGANATAAARGALEFDATAGAITHSGGISNSGVVRAVSGTTTINGIVSGSTPSYVPGLVEAMIDGSLDLGDTRLPSPGNFGIKLEPRMGQSNVVTQSPVTGWGDNDMWIYTGEFYDADGLFTFAENIDDAAMVAIDGVIRLNDATFNRVTSTATTSGVNTVTAVAGANTGTPLLDYGNADTDANPLTGNQGWHTLEIRFRNSAGGAGPAINNGFTANYGFGLNVNGTTALDGGAFERPIDPGNGTLFRTLVGGKGDVAVTAGVAGNTLLSVGGLSETGAVTLNGGDAFSARLAITTADSAADSLSLTGLGISAKGGLEIGASRTFTVGTLDVIAGGTLAIGTSGTGNLVVTGANTINAGAAIAVDIQGGSVEFRGAGTGGGKVQVGGGATMLVNGSLSGAVDVLGNGTLKGAGSILGNTVLSAAAKLAPGNNTVGTLTFENTTLTLGTGVEYQFQAGGTKDKIAFTGAASGLSFAGAWTLKISDLGAGMPQGQSFLLFDGDVAGAPLNGGSIFQPTFDYSGTDQWTGGVVSYIAATNDIVLTGVIPEPGAALTLLAGAGSLLGLSRFRRRQAR